MAPKRKSHDAGSASKPKRSREVLSISEKVQWNRKKLCAEIARLCGKNEYSIREVMKSKENCVLVFLLHRILQKLLL